MNRMKSMDVENIEGTNMEVISDELMKIMDKMLTRLKFMKLTILAIQQKIYTQVIHQ